MLRSMSQPASQSGVNRVLPLWLQPVLHHARKPPTVPT